MSKNTISNTCIKNKIVTCYISAALFHENSVVLNSSSNVTGNNGFYDNKITTAINIITTPITSIIKIISWYQVIT